MIRNVIFALFAFVVVGFIILWIAGGGIRHITGGFKGAFSSTTTGQSLLPWQPPNLFSYVQIPGVTTTSQAEYEAMQKEAESSKTPSDVLTFGNPSPFYGLVKIVQANSDPRGNGPSQEYISVQAGFTNAAPVSIAGWSLESVVSGARANIPPAASVFVLGSVNELEPISLKPGESAAIVTGASPVGISFRENACTGYLSQFQPFTPSLSLQCPQPESELPLTAENIKVYGDACFDFIKTLPTCEFPQFGPASLSLACRDLIQTAFSYNGCVRNHQKQGSFSRDIWRAYLGSSNELWRNGHDAIRLLDARGQTVDVYVY